MALRCLRAAAADMAALMLLGLTKHLNLTRASEKLNHVISHLKFSPISF